MTTRAKWQRRNSGPGLPDNYVALSWQPAQAASGVTYNVYRSSAAPVPLDAAHRIASGLRFGSLGDSNGRVGDYYVVTAQNAYGESGPSNTAQAMVDCGWNCWYASGQFGPAGARRGYVTRSAGARPLAKPALQTTPPLSVTVITYEYDPLYRLTNASYTGSVTATYNYVYDSVGNMTAYTETVGANTTSVNRTFNAANQLVTATDTQLGTTSYTYDGNGNLIHILPPGVNAGEAGEQQYSYNQRNLLLTVATGAGGGVYTPNASYAYDGDNRLAQVNDWNGGLTTYQYDAAGQ
ncbi:MAG TPA: RHS repeat protein, partial [Chloroflexi bacterium]|nr:RHS repeat protein [Chloroflexota bacterium]